MAVAARETINRLDAYVLRGHSSQPYPAWTTPSFAMDAQTVRDGKAQPFVVDAVTRFSEWRTACEEHEARSLGNLEHVLRVWEYYEKKADNVDPLFTAFFGGCGMRFTSRPSAAVLERLGRKRIVEMSPLTDELRAIGRGR